MSFSQAPQNEVLQESFKISLLSLFIFLIFAASLPITQDEAYYLAWSKALDWGYFDHPPGVSLLAYLSPIGLLPFLKGRFFACFLGFTSSWMLALFLQSLGLPKKAWLSAFFLAQLSLGGLLVGAINTPDIVLTFSWVGCLLSTSLALRGKKGAWALVGLFWGLGLLGKYTAVLYGGVLLALALKRRELLRLKSFYLAPLFAALVFSPHIWWNSQNAWAPIRFQLRHGLDAPQSQLRPLELPFPQRPAAPVEPHEGAVAPDSNSRLNIVMNRVWDSIFRFLNFLASQGLLFGFFLPVLVFSKRRTDAVPLETAMNTLLQGACFVPLLFFGLIAFFSKVEANWPGMFIFGASSLLAKKLSLPSRPLFLAALGNFLVLAALSFHAKHPYLPIPVEKDRVLKETHGFESLAGQVKALNAPVFAENYQLVSMLRFYNPQQSFEQWPGINRASEFTRRLSFQQRTLAELKETGFYLVTTDSDPFDFPDFTDESMLRMDDCRSDFIVSSGKNSQYQSCDAIHTWYLVHYLPRESVP